MDYEFLYRLAAFGGLFALFAAAETLAPRRRRVQPRNTRWMTNWAIVLVDTLTLRALALLLPLLAVGAALDAEAKEWGLMQWLGLPLWVEMLATILIFDFAIWLQHLVTHKIPVLWRIHRVHHADRDIDVTTGIRFHPVEIALSMLLKIGLVYLIGPPALGVLLFEIVLNGTTMFNHSNIRLPVAADAVLRQIVVTPDMHRVHHSINGREHDSNYGFSLSVWDRLFGTYVPQPEFGHESMTVGLQWQDDRPSRLGWSLALPFRRT